MTTETTYCWIVPAWAKESKIAYEEYIDSAGRVVGVVKPFGDKWFAGMYTGVNAECTALFYDYIGIYVTQDQAKAALLKYVGVTTSRE